jgi:hypothetical protein
MAGKKSFRRHMAILIRHGKTPADAFRDSSVYYGKKGLGGRRSYNRQVDRKYQGAW